MTLYHRLFYILRIFFQCTYNKNPAYPQLIFCVEVFLAIATHTVYVYIRYNGFLERDISLFYTFLQPTDPAESDKFDDNRPFH